MESNNNTTTTSTATTPAQNSLKRYDEMKQRLDILFTKMSLRNPYITQQTSLTDNVQEWHVQCHGFITAFDLQYCQQKGFEITEIKAISLDELLVVVREKVPAGVA